MCIYDVVNVLNLQFMTLKSIQLYTQAVVGLVFILYAAGEILELRTHNKFPNNVETVIYCAETA